MLLGFAALFLLAGAYLVICYSGQDPPDSPLHVYGTVLGALGPSLGAAGWDRRQKGMMGAA